MLNTAMPAANPAADERYIRLMRPGSDIPILGICAYASGTGKTTLLEAVLPILGAYGLKVSVIKQARADFDIDRPGKDSHRLRGAGAAQVLVSSPRRWALMAEVTDGDAMDGDGLPLEQLVRHLDTRLTDLILVEGFKTAPIPKIEVFRQACANPLLAAHDPDIIAVAADVALPLPVALLNLNRAQEIAAFVLDWLTRQRQQHLATSMEQWLRESPGATRIRESEPMAG
ncbi:MAG TPA: molybdopterin-guanine dinucleotide biosynthesis protein B [Novimethylophilus sp.]|jgi:molybdopterin-guanine dinucleotide biosynthesis protein B|uniref:molybdopterin-guanine dinucleotide biosynthesis protein B n=1 Tax=Novimethylophilus sp. TaxID=2137426 RepID=UPI002F42141D